MVPSGASGAIEGEAIGCGVGADPRNGGGGVLVWTVTSPSRMSFSVAAARAGLPSSCNASCNRFKVAPAVGPAWSAAVSALRPATAVCTRSSATANRACGSMISRTSSSGEDGVRLAAAEAFGVAACAATDAVGAVTVALVPSAVCSVWRSTISAAFRSGAPDEGIEPDASDASSKMPDF